MPAIADTRRPRAYERSLTRTDRAIQVSIVLLVAWGTLAFGAVYPWAYVPLLSAAAAGGAVSLFVTRRGVGLSRPAQRLVVVLAAIAGGAVLQSVPVPTTLRMAISPATEPFLRDTNVQYAAAVATAEQSADRLSSLPARPLSIDPAATIRGLLILMALTVLLAGLTRFFSRVGILGTVPWIIGLALLVAVIGIVQKAVLGDHAFAGMKIYGFWTPQYKLTTPFGPYVNKNHYAGWMVMALPVAMGYFLAMADAGLRAGRRGWRNRLLWLSSPEGGRLQLVGFGVIVMGAALTLTMSRSGIACFGVAVLVAAFVIARREQSMAARAGLAVTLVLLLIVPLLWARVDVAGRFTSGGVSIELRRQAWRDAMTIIREFPLVGTGLNTYGTATLKYQTAKTDLHFREAHNDYLQIAAEGGFLLGIPAVIAILCCAGGIRERFRSDEHDPLSYWLRFGATTGLVAIAVQSLVEFSLQLPGNAVLFVVLCAIALHRAPEPVRSRDARA